MYDKHATSGLTWDAMCRRAGGRRGYNRLRQFLANYRLTKVVELLRETGFRRGYQTIIANALGVHRSTICRDLRRLHLRRLHGRDADKMIRGLAVVAKHARDDAKADEAYEERKLAAPTGGGQSARIRRRAATADLTTQVPKWLPRLAAQRQAATHRHEEFPSPSPGVTADAVVLPHQTNAVARWLGIYYRRNGKLRHLADPVRRTLPHPSASRPSASGVVNARTVRTFPGAVLFCVLIGCRPPLRDSTPTAVRLRCPDCGGPLNWFREV